MGAKRRPAEIRVNEAWCKSCGICIEFCPKNVFEAKKNGVPQVARLDDCIWCELCELRCPDFAIELLGSEEVAAKDSKPQAHAG